MNRTGNMNLLYFASKPNPDLKRRLPCLLSGWNLRSFDSLDAFLAFLEQPLVSADNMVLLELHSGDEVHRLLDGGAALQDLDIFVIIDGIEEPEVGGIHALSPRLVMFTRPDPSAVCSILAKMGEKKNRNPHVISREVNMKSGHEAAMSSVEGKYLTFMLADQEYGVSILKVKEIIGLMPITPVPQAPPAVKGVINLRGSVIPISDLRLRFNLPETNPTDHTCIIVMEIDTRGEHRSMGIVVDAVCEVTNFRGEDIEAPPSLNGAMDDLDYIIGMAKIDGGVKILVDVDQVLEQEAGFRLSDAA
jgi:purine-binding chemotaxis protein CheW